MHGDTTWFDNGRRTAQGVQQHVGNPTRCRRTSVTYGSQSSWSPAQNVCNSPGRGSIPLPDLAHIRRGGDLPKRASHGCQSADVDRRARNHRRSSSAGSIAPLFDDSGGMPTNSNPLCVKRLFLSVRWRVEGDLWRDGGEWFYGRCRVREVTCPKRRCSGFEPATLDFRVVPRCPPGPNHVQWAVTRRASATRCV